MQRRNIVRLQLIVLVFLLGLAITLSLISWKIDNQHRIPLDSCADLITVLSFPIETKWKENGRPILIEISKFGSGNFSDPDFMNIFLLTLEVEMDSRNMSFPLDLVITRERDDFTLALKK